MNILTLGDVDIATRTIWMEARGEPYEGMKAVAHVLKNRRDAKEGDRWSTIAQVCLDWLQFSGWREADVNFNVAQQLVLNDKLFRVCLMAFLESYDENDFTLGARHYHASNIFPVWAKDQKPCYKLGKHVFYNTVK